MNCHISNSTRNILARASLMVECIISDMLDVFRTCLMSVSKTWCLLLPTAILISLIELWTCGFYEDIEVNMLPSRNVVLHLLLMLLKICTDSCYFLYETSNCIGSQSSNFYTLHEFGIIPGDGAWYQNLSNQLVNHE